MSQNPSNPPYEPLLKEIGLTESEIKIYLFLLKNSPSTKTPLVKATAISGSKIYEVIHRLAQKGLASITIENNIQHFSAASPDKIKDYLKRKQQEITNAEQKINHILPSLVSLANEPKKTAQVAIFTGWEGLATVYDEAFSRLPKSKKEKMYVIGASSGQNTAQTERFFKKYGKLAINKADLRIIFNTRNRSYVARIQQSIGYTYVHS